jgi:hypothetical protein
MDKVVEYYKKRGRIKIYFFDILKEQKLSSEMQKRDRRRRRNNS